MFYIYFLLLFICGCHVRVVAHGGQMRVALELLDMGAGS